ncbi:MAG: hypothetical protein M1491_02190 [Deltaproteobacteria bacterium]|nr:hypothetical protein [Deltaproteobacteria bacterium]MCL5277240.1 hypothetical protein [Deltaproteobacteria bacterium]
MKKAVGICVIVIGLMLAVGIDAHAKGGHTFDRKFDPVVVPGADLAPFIGHAIGGLRLYRAEFRNHRQTVRPIPFQIDERDEYGDWVFDFDKHGDFVPFKRQSLAPQDELVFMSKDAGERLAVKDASSERDLFTNGASGRTGLENGTSAQHGAGVVEIKLTDPLNDSNAYVYLAYFQDDPPALSPVHYVQYNPTTDRIDATLYDMGFSKKAPVSYDYYVIPKAAGGEGINIFDRFKMRLDISTFLFNLHRDEDDFKSRLVGYIQGPVRVIRRVANSMDVVFGIQSSSVLSDSMYYYDYFQFPTIVNIPIDMRKLYVVKKAKLVTTTDFNHNAIGMYFYNSNNPKGIEITGTMSRAQAGLDMSAYDWAVVSGPQGAWMNRVVMGKDVPFIKNLYFVDDRTKLDPPENEPGQIGSTGYDFGNLLKAAKGTYTFTSYIYVPIGYRPGDERPWLNIIDHPIHYTVSYDNKQVVPVRFDLKRPK